jgi:hypothetical protein
MKKTLKTKEQRCREENIQHGWAQIERYLNNVLHHFKDAREAGNINERLSEIERHTRAAKDLYDYLDNFATIKASL